MIRIAKDDLGVQVVHKIARENALYGRLRADGHKDRSLNRPVGSMKDACPGSGNGAGGLKLKSKHRPSL